MRAEGERLHPQSEKITDRLNIPKLSPYKF